MLDGKQWAAAQQRAAPVPPRAPPRDKENCEAAARILARAHVGLSAIHAVRRTDAYRATVARSPTRRRARLRQRSPPAALAALAEVPELEQLPSPPGSPPAADRCFNGPAARRAVPSVASVFQVPSEPSSEPTTSDSGSSGWHTPSLPPSASPDSAAGGLSPFRGDAARAAAAAAAAVAQQHGHGVRGPQDPGGGTVRSSRPSDINNEDSFDYVLVLRRFEPESDADTALEQAAAAAAGARGAGGASGFRRASFFAKGADAAVDEEVLGAPARERWRDAHKLMRMSSSGSSSTVMAERRGGVASLPMGTRQFCAISEILSRLRNAGLEFKRVLSADGKHMLLKLRAPPERLEVAAEVMRLVMRTNDGRWSHFTFARRAQFCRDNSYEVAFHSSDRQHLINFILTSRIRNGGAELGTHGDLAAYIECRFPLHMEYKLDQLRRHWVYFWRQARDPSRLGTAVYFAKHCLEQPLDSVASYFGHDVAFYFAWLQFYTRWLVPPSVAGVVLFALQVAGGELDHPLSPFYALFMAVWASLLMVFWRKREQELAYRWGTLDFEEEESPRPEFTGDLSRDKLTNEWVVEYPAWKRWRTYAYTLPVTAVCIAATALGTFGLFSVRDGVLEGYTTGSGSGSGSGDGSSQDAEWTADILSEPNFWFLLLFTPCVYGLTIPLLDMGFSRMAVRFNEAENHEFESDFHTQLILKVFGFRFVTAFASLYYYSFASRANAMLRVGTQLASIMVVGQVGNNMVETVLPYVYQRWRRRTYLARLRERSEGGGGSEGPEGHGHGRRWLEDAHSTAWEEKGKPRYSTFEDYTEMTIQFGYVTLFSMAFPLAPLLALLNNVVEIRSDAFKLTNCRRPVARRVGNIGVWSSVLQGMSVLAILTNCATMALLSDQASAYFPWVTSEHRVLFMFVFEHVLLLLKLWITVASPALPHSVKEDMLRRRRLEIYNELKEHEREVI